MNEKLENIINEALKCGVRVEVEWSYVHSTRVYLVHGFSKSGTVQVFAGEQTIADGHIEVHARYNEVDYIEDFQDLARIAKDWYQRYQNRSPFENPDEKWKQVWVNLGWIKIETKVVEAVKFT